MPRPPPAAARTLCVALPLLGAACSPALDWREVRPQDSGATLLMPCRPASHARRLPLAGTTVQWTLYACTAGDATWAIGHGDLADPARVDEALAALEATALAAIGATAAQSREPARVEGATPHPGAVRLQLRGRRGDGSTVEEQVALFRKGTRVFQATAVGARLPPDAVETFFDSLRTP